MALCNLRQRIRQSSNKDKLMRPDLNFFMVHQNIATTKNWNYLYFEAVKIII